MESHATPSYRCTTREAAALLGIQPGSVRQLVRRGRLKRSGGTPRNPWYALSDVAALHAERQQPAPPLDAQVSTV
ncbi:helix-turn-helix domain-containing protein [Streptomyces sp. NPDC007264]|uniref:helix-turn-helix domain-containing protein n=1 Tax=Streptomyces sp. NPDC007264 TaxID=3364777 RepID=UPI0036DA7329